MVYTCASMFYIYEYFNKILNSYYQVHLRSAYYFIEELTKRCYQKRTLIII